MRVIQRAGRDSGSFDGSAKGEYGTFHRAAHFCLSARLLHLSRVCFPRRRWIGKNLTLRPALAIAACLLLSACASSGVADRCIGRQQLTPNAGTRSYIVKNDVPFARQTAFNNATGRMNGCW